MNFIIIADKYKRGMKSKGAVGLIKLNQRYNIFEKQYNVIRKNFKRHKIIYIYGFDNKKVESYFDNNKKKFSNVQLVYNDSYADYGCVYALSKAIPYMNNDFFILNGDSVFKSEVFSSFKPSGCSQIYVNPKEKYKLGCVINDNQLISNIAFDIDNYLMDIFYIHKKDSKSLKEYCQIEKYRNYFIFEVLNKMIDNGNQFKANICSKKNMSSKINKIKAGTYE